ncbi:MAG: hypothetical protein ABII76_27365, partial [Pseudomonadota bacterium]
MSERRTGTREWSAHSANCLIGCSHDCRYCYARANAVRYGRCTAEEWAHPRINERAMGKKWTKQDGVVMCPTSHDILPAFLEPCT